jgi:hypothetical protein
MMIRPHKPPHVPPADWEFLISRLNLKVFSLGFCIPGYGFGPVIAYKGLSENKFNTGHHSL